ncbi:MAG: hypothetical protein OXI24_09335, partial [Candidatus Poribacteria bacterium]|nr:hypothetical protein [Candidatus Poribacteria bacterium]
HFLHLQSKDWSFENEEDDKDFGEIVFRQGRIHAGVVLIRLDGLSKHAKARSISTIFANQGTQLLEAFSVISPGRVRIRRSQ